jgi:hypothetical protein
VPAIRGGVSSRGAWPGMCQQLCVMLGAAVPAQQSAAGCSPVSVLMDAWHQLLILSPRLDADQSMHDALAGTSPGTGTCSYQRAARSGRTTVHAHPSLRGYEQQSSSSSRRRPSNSRSSSSRSPQQRGRSNSSSQGSSNRAMVGSGGGGGGHSRSLQPKQQQQQQQRNEWCSFSSLCQLVHCVTVTSPQHQLCEDFL